MIFRPLLILVLSALLLGVGGDETREGRRGNALYAEGRYEEAAAAYRAGLAALGRGETGAVAARLWNNLGAALHRQGRYEEARRAFRQALTAAASGADYVRAAYNAGTNEAVAGALEAALDLYEQTLLADPAHEDARYNYEYVKRQLQRQQQQQQDQEGASPPQDRQQAGNQQRAGAGAAEDRQGQRGQQQAGQQREEGQQQGGEAAPSASDARTGSGQDLRGSDALSREQALRILQALQNQEQQLLRQMLQQAAPRHRVEKDW